MSHRFRCPDVRKADPGGQGSVDLGRGFGPGQPACSGGHSPPGGSGYEASWARDLGDGRQAQSRLFSHLRFAVCSWELSSAPHEIPGVGTLPQAAGIPSLCCEAGVEFPAASGTGSQGLQGYTSCCPTSVFYLTSLPSGVQLLLSPGTRGLGHTLWASLQHCPSEAWSLRTQLCSPSPGLDAMLSCSQPGSSRKTPVLRSPGHTCQGPGGGGPAACPPAASPLSPQTGT